MCVTSLLCGLGADLWPFYGKYCKRFYLCAARLRWGTCGAWCVWRGFANMNNIEANQSETTSREDKFRVRSIGISDFQSNAKSENEFQRWHFCFWIFIFYRSIGKSAKGLEKLFLRTAVLHAHARLLSVRTQTGMSSYQSLWISFHASVIHGRPQCWLVT